MWFAPFVSHVKALARARLPATAARRPARRKQGARRLTIEQLETRALLSSYSPFPGVVLASVGADTSDTAYDAFLDHSGKIVTVGQTYSRETRDYRLALFRFQSAGTADPTFGTQGVATTALPRTWDTHGYAAAEYPSKETGSPPDRILVGGYVAYKGKTARTTLDFALARYNSSGTLDTTFGNNGTVQSDLGGDYEDVTSILVQDDGRIVAAGNSSSDQLACFALARYTADGELDPTFGTEGVVKTSFGSEGAAVRNAIWDEGKILAVGRTRQFVLARYTLDGDLDPSFGDGGIVTTSFEATASPNAAAVDSSGNIIVVGSFGGADGTPIIMTLARYHRDGSLDTAFGTDGIVFTQGFEGSADDVAILPDGKILVGGAVCDMVDPSTGQTLRGFLLARYNPDGTLDTDFGTGGITVTPILDSAELSSAGASSMALQADGKIVLAGRACESTPTGKTHVALARYHGSDDPNGTYKAGDLDETFGVVPPGITVTPTSGLVTTEAGGTASFSVVLDSQPTADVTIAVSSSDTTEGTVSVSSLTFTPLNWNIAQTVTVSGLDDRIRDGDIAYTVVLAPAVSSDSDYSSLNPSDVWVTNKDNEKGKITGSALSRDDLIDAALTDLVGSNVQRGKKTKLNPMDAAILDDLLPWEA
jgi:uncharacterized delta-60 repeat protein